MLSQELEEKLKLAEQRYLELQYQLSSPEVVSDREKLTKLGKELKELEELYNAYKNYKKILSDLNQARELLKNEELKELAKEEVERLTKNALKKSYRPHTTNTTALFCKTCKGKKGL